jgi:hypothetical protein
MNPIGINYAYWSETWDAEPLPLVSRTQLCGFDILEINAQKIIKTGVRIAKTDRRLFASARMVDLRRSMLIRFAKCSSKNLLGRNCRLLAARGDVYAHEQIIRPDLRKGTFSIRSASGPPKFGTAIAFIRAPKRWEDFAVSQKREKGFS